MFEPDTAMEKALRFSRFDPEHPLSSVSAHSFQLEDRVWPTAEHYYQTLKFDGLPYSEVVQRAVSAKEAYKLGNKWLKKKRKDFAQVRKVLMTRALYSKAIQNDDIKKYLLGTGEQLIVESSQYGHYWGVGRDQRGTNVMGVIWMEIRDKLNQELSGNQGN